MSSLPAYPPSEVATKTDIARIGDRFDQRFDGLVRLLITTTVGAMTALTAIFSVIVTVFS